MLDEMVVSDTVKPTDCAFTSQKQTSRPQVFDRGRYAIQAAATVQRMLATVAVMRRAAEGLVVLTIFRQIHTVGNVQNDCSTDDQGDDLHCIANRFELGSHGCAEAHVADDDCREGVHNTVGDGTIRSL
jgi:hypothetical protein